MFRHSQFLLKLCQFYALKGKLSLIDKHLWNILCSNEKQNLAIISNSKNNRKVSMILNNVWIQQVRHIHDKNSFSNPNFAKSIPYRIQFNLTLQIVGGKKSFVLNTYINNLTLHHRQRVPTDDNDHIYSVVSKWQRLSIRHNQIHVINRELTKLFKNQGTSMKNKISMRNPVDELVTHCSTFGLTWWHFPTGYSSLME